MVPAMIRHGKEPLNELARVEPDSPSERILRVARELFFTRGYRGVGIRELCETAGVKRGTFYHHFPSKEDLLLEVAEGWIAEVRSIFDEAFLPDVPPLERLHRLFRLTRDFNESVRNRTGRVQGCPLLVLTSDVGTTVEGVRKRMQDAYAELAAKLESVVSEEMASRGIPQGDARVAAEAILAYHQGVTLMARVADDPHVVTELGDGVLRLILEARALSR